MGFLTWTDEHGVTHLYRTLPKELVNVIAEESRSTFAGVLAAPMPSDSYIYIGLPYAEVRLPQASPNYTLCGTMGPADMPFPRGDATCLPCIALNQFLERNPWAKNSFV